jgi:transposase
VVIEAGTHSPWMSRLLEELGHEVVVANPRQVPLIGTSIRKDDQRDAELLARLGRVDPKLLAPVRHRSEKAQRDRALLQVRHALIRVRTLLINQARGLAKSQGVVFPRCSAGAFPRRVRESLVEEVFRGQEHLLEQIEQVTTKLRELDRQLEQLAEREYPETRRLRQVTGVGPLTSLCFVLTLETPQRFAKSRSVGAYLGLCPRRRDSGEQHPELRITKAGDSFLRQLLIQCAHYILGPFGPDSDLRRFGGALIAQGGPRAKKRARVAVARKLSVLVLALWRNDAEYEPLRQASRLAA